MRRVRGIWAKRDAGDRTLKSRSVLPRDPRSIVFRAIVNHQHLVTRTKRVQGAAEAERIIVRVQQGGNFRHLATLVRISQPLTTVYQASVPSQPILYNGAPCRG